MTEKLKTLMDRTVDGVDFAAVDVDAVVAAGDRKVRRRRGVTAVAGLAAAVIVGAGALAFLGGDERADDGTDPAAGIGTGATWAVGSTLHTPTGSTDLGHAILAYVRTAAGIAFISDDRAVYSYTGGEPERIGTVSQKEPRLISDVDGTRVGWLDDATSQLVVVDQATGRTELELEPRTGTMRPRAIDGKTLYWEDGRGTAFVVLDGGPPSDLAADGGDLMAADLVAVEDGLTAYSGQDGNVVVGDPAEGGWERSGVWGEIGAFSSDARWITFDGDMPTVFDTRNGRRVEFDIDGRVFATGYEFLDADTVMMIAGRTQEAKIELLRCEVPAGSCTVVEDDLGTFEDPARFALPVGEAMAADDG